MVGSLKLVTCLRLSSLVGILCFASVVAVRCALPRSAGGARRSLGFAAPRRTDAVTRRVADVVEIASTWRARVQRRFRRLSASWCDVLGPRRRT